MKKQVVSAVLAVVLMGGWYVAQAGPMGKGHGCRNSQPQAGETTGCRQQAGCRQEGDRLGPLTRMAGELGLSESQRQQVEAIMTEQYERDEPLREKIGAGKKQLFEAARGGAMDEAAIAELTAEQGRLIGEMMFSRIRVKNQIFAVLTPEQQEQAAKLDENQGPGCGGPGCGLPGCGPCQGPGVDAAVQSAPRK